MARPLALLFAAALALAGCGRPFVPATPGTFTELPGQYDYDYRAVSADGVVLGIKAHENDPRVDLTYAEKAYELHMRSVGGYALLSKQPVQAEGVAGVQFRFGHDEGQTPHLYYVTLFVTDRYVYILEAGAPRDIMERYEAPIGWHVQHFRPR